MSRQYKYIQLSNYYVCLEQNTAVLAWLLYFRRKDLLSIFTPWIKSESPSLKVNYLRYIYALFINNGKLLGLFLQYQFKLRAIDSYIELPTYGHLCKHVHKGYKVFNLISNTVIKIFDSDVHADHIADELNRLQSISHYEFSPTLVKSNVNERWYEEKYVSGSPHSSYRSHDSSTLLQSFRREIAPCLNKLISFNQPKSTDPIRYVDKVVKSIESALAKNNKGDLKDRDRIRYFSDSILKRLHNENKYHIYLVFSHGDFCPANILTTKSGLKLLDWESVSYRSALFDFYSYFFYRPVFIDVPVEQMFSELCEALPRFISELSLISSDIPDNLLARERTYRWIYYLERIGMLVDRHMTDKNLNIMDIILRYIEAFNYYDEKLGGSYQSNPRKQPEPIL